MKSKKTITFTLIPIFSLKNPAFKIENLFLHRQSKLICFNRYNKYVCKNKIVQRFYNLYKLKYLSNLLFFTNKASGNLITNPYKCL